MGVSFIRGCCVSPLGFHKIKMEPSQKKLKGSSVDDDIDPFDFSVGKPLTPTKRAGNKVFVYQTQAVGGRIIIAYCQKLKDIDEASFTPHLLNALQKQELTLSMRGFKLVG